MNQEKVGKFIASLRKEKNLTQEQLAEKLNITKNAVSKWERGLGLMDLSLLQPLSKILNVTVTELLNGERASDNEQNLNNDTTLLNVGYTSKDFKKYMFKVNKAFRKYYIYEIIFICLLIIIVGPNLYLIIKNLLPLNIIFINALLIIIMSVPLMIIDIKNEIEIKKMYKHYLKKREILEYKDKSKMFILTLVIIVIGLIINLRVTLPNILKLEDLKKQENNLIFTSNKGNEINTNYESFDGFKIKIPIEFKIMKDEVVKIKYPSGNPPSLVYTNDKTTINIALVLNDVKMQNTEIEEYVKLMESTYKNYTKDVKMNFWEINNHKIGEIEFITEVPDTEIYNHLMVFSVNGKLRIVNFNCTKEYLEEWQDVSNFIINSIIFE